jgi:hypothetical protein
MNIHKQFKVVVSADKVCPLPFFFFFLFVGETEECPLRSRFFTVAWSFSAGSSRCSDATAVTALLMSWAIQRKENYFNINAAKEEHSKAVVVALKGK